MRAVQQQLYSLPNNTRQINAHHVRSTSAKRTPQASLETKPASIKRINPRKQPSHYRQPSTNRHLRQASRHGLPESKTPSNFINPKKQKESTKAAAELTQLATKSGISKAISAERTSAFQPLLLAIESDLFEYQEFCAGG